MKNGVWFEMLHKNQSHFFICQIGGVFLKDALEWEFEFLSLDKWIEKVWKEGVVKWIFLYRKWPKFLVILKGGLPGILNYFFKKSSQFFVPFGILSSFFSATKSSPKATLRGAVKILLHVLQHWRKMTNHNFMTTLWTIKCEECVESREWSALQQVNPSFLSFFSQSEKFCILLLLNQYSRVGIMRQNAAAPCSSSSLFFQSRWLHWGLEWNVSLGNSTIYQLTHKKACGIPTPFVRPNLPPGIMCVCGGKWLR